MARRQRRGCRRGRQLCRPPFDHFQDGEGVQENSALGLPLEAADFLEGLTQLVQLSFDDVPVQDRDGAAVAVGPGRPDHVQ
jgi:hypothetical protein